MTTHSSTTNSTATAPFGAIDTPGQGETISGSNYANFGWVLSPGTRRAGATAWAYEHDLVPTQN